MKKLSLLAVVLLFVNCSSKESKFVKVGSNGMINQVLVAMDENLWIGQPGETLRAITEQEVFGLPQPEPSFKVTRIPTNAFKNLFLSQKNVLYVSLGKEEFSVADNKYAQPQKIITIKAPTEEALDATLRARGNEIIAIFKNSDITVIQNRAKNTQFVGKEKLKTLNQIGIDLVVPSEFRLVDDTGDFLWLRKRTKKGHRQAILVYELPIKSDEDEQGKNINSVRDTIGKKYIPGQFEGTYYITEKAFIPETKKINLAGLQAYETRGKWEMKNDFMAGPFINYTIVDKAKNRLIVLEGFVFAPATSKRDYVFELEALLKTVTLK